MFQATTLMELQRELELAETLLKESNKTLSVSSGCELFTRFVTRTSLDIPVILFFFSQLYSFQSFSFFFKGFCRVQKSLN